MKNLFYFVFLPFLLTLFLYGCTSNTPTSTEAPIKLDNQKDDDDPSLPFEQRLKQYIERKLNTRPNENYSVKIYEENLNGDGKKDLIITVNRLENAIKTAEEKHLVSKSEVMGFFGNHNYMIYYSSITNKFTPPFIIASSPQRELKISFEHISSEQYKDVVVDYAIRNSQFRKIYLMLDDLPFYSFQWKLYDGWGTNQLEAYCFDYGTGSYSNVKDIIINKATMKNIGETDDYNAVEPEITCTNQLVKRFFFNTQDRKYYTPN
ncbi:MAG: hypothetical protein M9916_01905 [Crocinitomicaceae bacterium]|nr:hypothetical protein [Crocinitomicaceae bacterium]